METKTAGFLVAMLVIAAFAIGVAYLLSNPANSERGGQVLGSLSKTQADSSGSKEGEIDKLTPCVPTCEGGGYVTYSSCQSVGGGRCGGACRCSLGNAPNETECSCGYRPLREP